MSSRFLGAHGSMANLFTKYFSQLSLVSPTMANWNSMTDNLTGSNKKAFSFLHSPDNPKSTGWQLHYRSGLCWNLEMSFLFVITVASVFLNVMGVWLLLH